MKRWEVYVKKYNYLTIEIILYTYKYYDFTRSTTE